MKGFYTLRKEFGEDNDKHIARFYIAREFNMEATRSSLQEYLTWWADLESKYTWQDF